MRSGKPVGLGPHFPGSTSRTPQAALVFLRRPGALIEDRLPSVGEKPFQLLKPSFLPRLLRGSGPFAARLPVAPWAQPMPAQ